MQSFSLGFPTETDEGFADTVELLKETKPEVVNLSRYSARPGTDAAEWDQVDVATVKQRSKKIFDLTNKISFENNKNWIGWTGNVLFDEMTDDGIKGRNFAYKPIFVKDSVDIGQSHAVKITQATNHSLIGEIAS